MKCSLAGDTPVFSSTLYLTTIVFHGNRSAEITGIMSNTVVSAVCATGGQDLSQMPEEILPFLICADVECVNTCWDLL